MPDLFEPRGRKWYANRELHPDDRFGRPACSAVKHHWRYLEIGRAPRLRSGYILIPNQADFYLPRARKTGTRDRTRTGLLILERDATRLLRLHGHCEIGTSGWIRTITVPLNRRADYCYPTLVETGGRDGCCPRSILLDRQANMLLLLTSF